MRFVDLRLRAVGPFTDRELDLSPGEEGLHVVFGPNEAGKSSALRALRALLFGFDARTTDDFLHDYKQLRVGARLRRKDGVELVAFRRKGNKNTLVDAADKPLGDDALAPFLGGVTGPLFDLLFGLDHEALVHGGAELLAGKGEVGQSLFAAAPGGAHLRQVLARLDEEAESLFKARGQNQRINLALRGYDDERRRISERALAGATWTRAQQERDDAAGERGEVKARLAEIQRESRRLERLRRTLPRVARLRALRAALAEHEETVVLPDGFTAQRVDLMRRLDDARALVDRHEREVERLAESIAAMELPEALLASAGLVDDLHQRLGSHRKAQADVPMVRGKLEACDEQARVLTAELRPGAEALVPPTAAARAHVQELAQDHGRRHQAAKLASEQLLALDEELRRLDDAEGRRPPARDPGPLRAAVQHAARLGDLDAMRAEATRLATLGAEQARQQLAALGRWDGALAEVEGLPLPLAETIDRHVRVDADLRDARRLAETRREEHARARAAVDRRIEALRSAGDVPTEATLAAERAARDAQWGRLRPSLVGLAPPRTEAEADAYEGATRSADDVGDRLRREADRVAQLAALLAELDGLVGSAEVLDRELARIAGAERGQAAEWRAAWAPSAVDPLPPAEMRAWLAKHERLTGTVQRWKASEAEAARLATLVADQRAAVASALEALGEPPPEAAGLAPVWWRGDAVATRLATDAQERAEAAHRRDDLVVRLARATVDSTAAGQALAAWTDAWRAAVTALDLGAEASPQVASAVLDRLDGLGQILNEAKGFRKRLDGIRRDAAEFEAGVAALVGAVAPDLSAAEPGAAVAQLRARLDAARAESVRHAELGKQQAAARVACIDERARAAQLEARLATLCRQAGTADPVALAGIEVLSDERRRIERERGDVERQLVEDGDGEHLESLIAAAEAADADTLPGRLAELQERQIADEARRSELDQRIGRTEQELAAMDGGTGAADAAEAAQRHLADVRSGVERFVRVRLAADVLRREVERWRAAQEGPVVARASEIFAALTLGSFARLRTDFGADDLPVLKGERPAGSLVGVDAMSTGTRDQLYLALRLASLERQLEAHEPLPFLVDDVLVDFDDARAAAALRVLAELSRRTQVLVFTHHERIVELAGALPVCTVHRLVVPGAGFE